MQGHTVSVVLPSASARLLQLFCNLFLVQPIRWFDQVLILQPMLSRFFSTTCPLVHPRPAPNADALLGMVNINLLLLLLCH
jgi:hypothetical protein